MFQIRGSDMRANYIFKKQLSLIINLAHYQQSMLSSDSSRFSVLCPARLLSRLLSGRLEGEEASDMTPFL